MVEIIKSVVGSVLISLFKGDGSFWIVQDSNKHLLVVPLTKVAVSSRNIWCNKFLCLENYNLSTMYQGPGNLLVLNEIPC